MFFGDYSFTSFSRAPRTAEEYMYNLDPLDFEAPPKPWQKKPDVEPNLLTQIGSVAAWGALGAAAGVAVGVAAVTIPAITALAGLAAAAITGTALGAALVGASVGTAALLGAGLFASSRFLFSRKTRGLRYSTFGAMAGLLIGASFGMPLIGASVGFLAVACAYSDHRHEENDIARGQARKDSWDDYLRSAGDEYCGSILRPNPLYSKRHDEIRRARTLASQRKGDRLRRQIYSSYTRCL
jgi:hypothetical protein